MQILKLAGLAGLSATLLGSLGGCLSIDSGAKKSVSLETRSPAGQAITDATCKLTNSKGTWTVNTPALVSFTQSHDDLVILCTKMGELGGSAKVKSSPSNHWAASFVAGGAVSLVADGMTGALFNYPSAITGVLGRANTIIGPSVIGPDPSPTATATSPGILGIEAREISGAERAALRAGWVQSSSGVAVQAVMVNSPAAKAGLKPDDIIRSINGIEIKNTEVLKDTLQTWAGRHVRVVFYHTDRHMTAIAALNPAQ